MSLTSARKLVLRSEVDIIGNFQILLAHFKTYFLRFIHVFLIGILYYTFYLFDFNVDFQLAHFSRLPRYILDF